VRHFDGRHTLNDIQDQVLRDQGRAMPAAELERLVAELDRAMVLDGPTFASFQDDYRRNGVRPAAFAGSSYRGTAAGLRAELERCFRHAKAVGSAEPTRGEAGHGRLRGVLSPHIDFERGGPVYTWAYQALAERSDADTFVILGVAHQPCRRRFALTRKDFSTPLGVAMTDRDYVERIAALAGDEFFDDELAHRSEHSVEFQVVFLQYLLGSRRPFTIVPILVGSFHDLLRRGADPIDAPDVRKFVEALRAAEAASGKKVAYIGGIDLCHVGPEFGDREPVDGPTLERVRAFDTAMLGRATALDAKGWFETAGRVDDRWRVCGLSATYTMLHALGPSTGAVLQYDQAVNPERTCCVTFASVAFESSATAEVSPRA
ncbi:MAG: AmmeMemoRadiSam system protein B, partial [Isosphaeraceae bacterium]|nr:AmmeMemoRadiSam system protein B [Isosphaeraceae bacterium]